MSEENTNDQLEYQAGTHFRDVPGRNTADYLIRTAQQHHVQISMMADTKSNIIITVSSIVLTLALGQAGDPDLRLSLLTLSVFTLVALLLSILAVLPKFRPVRVEDGPLPKYFNLLFFGHFSALSLDRYMHEMEEVLEKDSRVYEAIVKDLYELGIYLNNHKYRYLRWSYIFFLAGFLIAGVMQAVVLLAT